MAAEKTSRSDVKTRPEKSSRFRDDSLEHALSSFLKARRGDDSLAVFAAETGLPKPSLARYESGQQSITLQALQRIMQALDVTAVEIFGDALSRKVSVTKSAQGSKSKRTRRQK